MGHYPPPSVLLGIPKFSDWYPNQEEAFRKVVDWHSSPDRFIGLSLPTGSGKSVLAALAAHLLSERTVILTATKGLQRQLISDLAPIGAVEAKGQNNFRCTLSPLLRCDEGPCHEGMSCAYREDGCPYYDQLRCAKESSIVITNYSYFLFQTQFSDGMGNVKMLVADEAHEAFDALSGYLAVTVSRLEVEPLGITLPRQEHDWVTWRQWATDNLGKAEDAEETLSRMVKEKRKSEGRVPASMSRTLRSARATVRNLTVMSTAMGPWVVQMSDRGGWKFTPVWVADYGRMLFQGIPKVMMMSAILNEKMMDSVGVTAGSGRRFVEMGSRFPPQNTPIWHVSTARINRAANDAAMNIWMQRIDQVIQRRLDRKGIIFTVSYPRRDTVLQKSRFADLMMTHGQRDVIDMVQRFKDAEAPAIFVSPSITSGWDFAEDSGVRYIIIGKVPYPDTSDPVSKARHETDPEWDSFIAMSTLVQEAGRATRSATQKSEVLILDDSWKWYWPKFRKFAPKWFHERVRGSLFTVPDPLV